MQSGNARCVRSDHLGHEDRAAGYRAAGDVLMRLGYGHVFEREGGREALDGG